MSEIAVVMGPDGAGSARLDVPLLALEHVVPLHPFAVVGLEPLERGAATQVNVGGAAPGTSVRVSYDAAYTTLAEASAAARPPYAEPAAEPAREDRPRGRKARGDGHL